MAQLKTQSSRRQTANLHTQMLILARRAIESAGNTRVIHELSTQSIIHREGGVFVSVHVDGELRGCIGNLSGVDIHTGIINNALHAAYHDSRFTPIQSAEWKRMKIDINLLSEPKPLLFKDSNDLIKKIKGMGVILGRGYHQATYLPSVWEQLPEPVDFLENLCMKAGLSPDDWKNPGLTVQVYTSEEFSE